MNRTALGIFLVVIVVGIVSSMSSSHAVVTLNPHQQQFLRSEIQRRVKSPSDKIIVSDWPEASQLAEFVCRPLATKTIRQKIPQADKVILYSGDENAPHLVSPTQLVGTGEYRTGNDWTDFHYLCEISAETGKALSFRTHSKPFMVIAPGLVLEKP